MLSLPFFAALSWSPGGRTFITPRMCGHLYLVGFPLLDDDAWQVERCCGGGNGCVWRCWDGAMMCHVISPVKTGKDCFPVNLWCEVFNVLTVSTGQLTGFSVLLVWPGHRAYEVHGESRPHDFSIYRFSSWFEMFVILICVRMWLMWLSMMISSTSFRLILFAGLDFLFRYHTPQLQLFESPVYFQRAKDNMKMIFSTILDWKLQADGYPGEVASLSKWLGHNFSKAA